MRTYHLWICVAMAFAGCKDGIGASATSGDWINTAVTQESFRTLQESINPKYFEPGADINDPNLRIYNRDRTLDRVSKLMGKAHETRQRTPIPSLNNSQETGTRYIYLGGPVDSADTECHEAIYDTQGTKSVYQKISILEQRTRYYIEVFVSPSTIGCRTNLPIID